MKTNRKTEKLTLTSIKNTLSRAELREIMAGGCGVGDCGGYATQQCSNYEVSGLQCWYAFYEDCVANGTQL